MIPDADAARKRLPEALEIRFDCLLERALTCDQTQCCDTLFEREIEYEVVNGVSGSVSAVLDVFPVLASVLSCELLPVNVPALDHEPACRDADELLAVCCERFANVDVCEFLRSLDDYSIYCILGFRLTLGTVPCTKNVFRAYLIRTALLPYAGDTSRSLANKARAKHCERGALWGVVRGGVAMQNEVAERCVCAVLDAAVWINVFALTPGEVLLEVRETSGRGLRWTVHGEDFEFRGFLEPFR